MACAIDLRVLRVRWPQVVFTDRLFRHAYAQMTAHAALVTSYTAQMTPDSWPPIMTPPTSDSLSPPLSLEPVSPPSVGPLSPVSVGGGGGEMASAGGGPDWCPIMTSPPAKRRPPRPRPYAKTTRRLVTEEERRERKKLQNKSAATRYRQKKKEEQDTFGHDQDLLEKRNADLRRRVDGLTKELSYLKQLMQQVHRYKDGAA